MALAIVLGGQALAQDGQAVATTDITLTKTVEVYSYEDLTFSIDSYSIRPGDNIATILKGQGLWPQKPDQRREAQLLRLVGELNPVIANLDQISPGQTIYLPSAKGLDEARPGSGGESLGSDMELRNVATYQLDQPDQSPATVVVRRQVPPEPELVEGEYRLWPDGQPSATMGESQAGPQAGGDQGPGADETPAASPAAPLPRPQAAAASANEGPLATAADGTVYRTVKVRPGDTLERLLRREGLDRDLIYRQLIKLTVALNPGLRNPNLIVAGAELRIPTSGGYLAGGSPPAAVAVAPAGPAPPAAAPPPLAPAAGEKYSTPTKRLPAGPLPTMDSLNARSAIGIVFTRLGETMVGKGRLFLPLDEPPHFDIDTATTPILELGSGRKIVLDFSSAIPADLAKRFVAKYGEYAIFQPERRETLDKALGRLLGLTGYYRIYDSGKPFEGGRDVRLRISADWLVWPTVDTWNKGQPTIINLAPAADNGTPGVWVRFLADHGIKVIDLFQGRVIASSGKSPTPVNNFTIIDVDQNPSAFAAALIRSLGYSPRVGVSVDASRGRVVTGGAEARMADMPPVFWETDRGRNILEYGDLTTEDLQILRKNGFNIISCPRDFQLVLKDILATENITLGGSLVLNGNSTGGPSIELTIAGQSFRFNGRSYLFTPVSLPGNMTSLDPNQNVVVLHYQQAPVTVLSNNPSRAQAAAPAADPQTLSDGAGATITVEEAN
ncbi:MAG: LysM peptidoglycan-binding domain-containing protein [Deltaproteobacteria bacterium]|nr:LysM peptidoglycan-binding domain-containing protein [Deltaproteobacteria bacterium]